MLGRILYGVMQGVTSLRELEQLARADLGCMWVSGGISPDHANIGRFITLHEDSLSGAFFEQLTGRVLAATGADSSRLAGDGTVVEAACSHYRLLQQEAARQRAEAARREAEAHPHDPKRRAAAEPSEAVAATADERQAAKAAQGKSDGHLRVSPRRWSSRSSAVGARRRPIGLRCWPTKTVSSWRSIPTRPRRPRRWRLC